MTRPLLSLSLAVALLGGCTNPVLDERVALLGDDQGFEDGPIHRTGQPCLLCHGPGGEEPEMLFGGTLFHRPPQGAPFVVDGYAVLLEDATGQRVRVNTRGCGNFYVTRRNFDPVFPVYADVQRRTGAGWESVATMQSRIGREGSCSHCHTEPRGPLSAGVIYVPGAPGQHAPPRPGSCPDPRFLPPTDLPEVLW